MAYNGKKIILIGLLLVAINQTPAQAVTFQQHQEPMEGIGGGVHNSSIAFGDYDGDLDLDLAVSGQVGLSDYRLILFRNNNGTFTLDQEPMVDTGGLTNGSLDFGDYDGDLDLDLAVSGYDGLVERLILFRNDNGNFTLDQEPMPSNIKGVAYSSIAFGDYDNDDDLDLAVSGKDKQGNERLILFRNDNGNFTEGPEPMGPGEGVAYSSIAFGDYDNDNDLDLAVSGNDGTYRRLILFENNNGNFTLDQEPMGVNTGVWKGSIAFKDYDGDGYSDLAVSGVDDIGGDNRRLIIFKNNNGNFSIIESQKPMGNNNGVYYSSIGFGDYDGDLDLDLAVSGHVGVLYDYRLILFKNDNGNFTLDQEPMGVNTGVWRGSIAFGDYDNDGDLDLAVSGQDDSNNDRLIIYENQGLADPTLVLSDQTTGSTTYTDSPTVNVVVGNDSDASQWLISETQSSQPAEDAGWGSEPTTFTLSSGDGLKTVYIWVKDAAGNINTGPVSTTIILDTTPPAAITDLTGLCDSETGDVTLYWSTPGDDGWTGTLLSGSKYRIDYSTYSIAWSTTNYKVDIPTSGVAPHTQVSYTITGLTGDTTWYFQIWTADKIPLWSGLSNGATIWVNPILSVSAEPSEYHFETMETNVSSVSVTAITVTNTGNVTEIYSINCSSTTKWTRGDTPGENQFTLQSAFHPSQPENNDSIWKDDDILTESLEPCTTAAFSIDGTEHGKNVPPFDDNNRNYWFRLKTPLSTGTTYQQTITVTITAGSSYTAGTPEDPSGE